MGKRIDIHSRVASWNYCVCFHKFILKNYKIKKVLKFKSVNSKEYHRQNKIILLNEMSEFRVNEYITLKLENEETRIYINGEFFRQCTYLLLDIPIDKISSFDDIDSIDEASERLDNSLHPFIQKDGTPQRIDKIPPETEFWGHCSNLQVWSEYNYNTNLIHSNLAFPLLKKLTDVGDSIAIKVFKEEIAKRFNSGNKNVILFLLKEKYLNYLTPEEREVIFYQKSEKVKEFIDTILIKKRKLRTEEQYILRSLIGYGDMGLAELLKNRIMESFTSKNIDKLRLHNFYDYLDILFDKGIAFDKGFFFYENNNVVKNIIDNALKNEKTALKIGYPLLLMLAKAGDKAARVELIQGEHL